MFCKYAQMFDAVTEALKVYALGLRFVEDPQISVECHFLAYMPLSLKCIGVHVNDMCR